MTWTPGQPLASETERFLIRSLRPVDMTDTYLAWWADPEVQRGLNQKPRPMSREDAVKRLQRFDNKLRYHLGIFCKETGRLIGFYTIFVTAGQRVAKTNIVIGETDYWGKGVVIEVRERMLLFLFRVLNMHKVKGEIMGRNYASIFNYKLQGFTCEGVKREEIVDVVNGGRTDVYLFGLLRPEWEARQQAAAGTAAGAPLGAGT